MNERTRQTREAFAAWRHEVDHPRAAAERHLQALGQYCGQSGAMPDLLAFAEDRAARLDALAIASNHKDQLPRLTRYDGQGNRTESVEFHPSYHEIGRAVYATGVMARYREPGHEWVTLAYTYLLAQSGEAGHACPLACTAGLIKILQHCPHAPSEWLERLLDPNYDTHFHGSQFLTEVQGGSDVGANAVVARPTDQEHWYTLHGEKWFCSVVDADLFLVTARPEGERAGTAGVQAYVVPRRHSDGSVNDFRIRRLKDKLGTRSMASAEIDFEGALALHVGDFRDVVQIVLNTSRLYNAICCCGLLQRAWMEASRYARHREAFGGPIARFPAIRRTLANLHAEAWGARAVTFALAQTADRISMGAADDVEKGAWRALVNLNKYWTATQATLGVRDAIEVLGGNGAIEDFSVLPRLLRDSIVVEAWEGGHNVLCAQVLRDARRLHLHEHLFTWLERFAPIDGALADARQQWSQLVTHPHAEAYVRDLVDDLRAPIQAHLLRATTPVDETAQTAADHLTRVHSRGWHPMADTGLSKRIDRLLADLA
jgi:acyl-CoA dehydrogenase